VKKKKNLKYLLRKKGIVRSLGAHDVLSAMVAEQSGIETLFIGGFGGTASHLGLPDLNLITISEISDLVRRITRRVSIPVVGDGDTGHGGVHNVARTIQDFESAEAQGVILEDQVSPKRCGHFQGKDVVPAAEMQIKLRAARAARKNKDFIIIARTDAREGHGLQEAIRRANLYAKEGADVVFVEAPHSLSELKLIPKKVKAPLLVNMLTGGTTPNPPLNDLAKMGYKIAVYPIESLMVLVHGMRKLSEAIVQKGSVKSVLGDMVDFGEIKKVLHLEKYEN